MVRCFIGINLPEDVREKVLSVQDFLKKLNLNCKFVEPENFHISLSFLGEISEGGANEISIKLNGVCKRYLKFSLTMSSIILIPDPNFIKVIALGVTDQSGTLSVLSRSVKNEIGGDMKPPHITLCRVKARIDKDVVSKIKTATITPIEMKVNSICIVRSELLERGPVYTTISESKLL